MTTAPNTYCTRAITESELVISQIPRPESTTPGIRVKADMPPSRLRTSQPRIYTRPQISRAAPSRVHISRTDRSGHTTSTAPSTMVIKATMTLLRRCSCKMVFIIVRHLFLYFAPPGLQPSRR